MHTRERTRIHVIALIVLFVGMLGNRLFAEENQPPNRVKQILLATTHIGEPSKTQQLLSYSRASGVPIADIEKVLIRYVEAGWGASKDDDFISYSLSRSAVAILGDLGSKSAIPLLKNVATRTADTTLRRTAVRAIVRIGDAGLLDFCRQVFDDRKRFSDLDRYALYEELSPYVGVHPDAAKEATLFLGGGELGVLVLQFLVHAVSQELDAGNVMRLDRILCIASKRYRMSYERESILKRFEKSQVPKHREYFSKELDVLRESSGGSRTHLSITKTGRISVAELARQALKNPERYSDLDMLALYEELWASAQECQQVLMVAVQRETNVDNVIQLDRMLCLSSERYKMSYERESILNKFEETRQREHKEYFLKELDILRQCPHEKRTHTELPTLER